MQINASGRLPSPTPPLYKADPGPARQTRAPRFEKKNGGCFLNVDYIIRTYFEISQHTMLTKSILFTTLTTKTNDKCEGASKQSADLRIIPHRDCAPRFEIPGSATEYCRHGLKQYPINQFKHRTMLIYL